MKNLPSAITTQHLPEDMILEQFSNSQVISGKSYKTLQNYCYTIKSLNKFINSYYGEWKIYPLDSIQAFLYEGRTSKNWSKYTLWTVYKNLNVFFNWCVEHQILDVNPLSKLEKLKMPAQAPKSLTENEVKQLLNIILQQKYKYRFTMHRNLAVVLTFLYTGIRRSELLNLKVEDVDLENGFIYVTHGKGDKYREIPIEQNNLKPALVAYCNDKSRLNKSSKWFFIGTFSGRGEHDNRLSISALDRLFWNLSKQLNIRITAHRLRHTFATILLDNSGDIFTLKELMGHEDISTTCVYLKSTRKKKMQVINMLSFT